MSIKLIIEKILGKDNGATTPDTLSTAYPKINRNFDQTKIIVDDTRADVDNQLQRLAEVEASSKDGEVLAARGAYPSLKDRLNALDPGLMISRKTFTATEGQTVFDISDVGQYSTGQNRLAVTVGGVPQFSGIHFTETSSTSFTLSEGVAAGTTVITQWYEGAISLLSGHARRHMRGGGDEIDVTTLVGYENITAQLAETTDHLLEIPNSSGRIRIPTPYNTIQAAHPKVITITSPSLSNSLYYYWMAYTPYPLSDRNKENPCIAASIDGVKWDIVSTLNPLKEGYGTTSEYNSDTHLVFREDTRIMECWYRYVNEVTRVVTLRRLTSTDGVTWSTEEDMITVNYDEELLLSPAIIFENQTYKMWSCDYGKLHYRESVDGKIWSARVEKSVDTAGYYLWHVDAIKSDMGYEFIASAYVSDYYKQDLIYFKSVDNINFTDAEVIMKPSAMGWDNGMLYRSSLLKINNGYKVYYSARSSGGVWGIGLTEGRDIKKLNGSKLFVENLTVPNTIYLGDKAHGWIQTDSMSLNNGVSSFRLYPGDTPHSAKYLSNKAVGRKGIRLQTGQIELQTISNTETFSVTNNGTLQFNDTKNAVEAMIGGSWQQLSNVHIDPVNGRTPTESILSYPEGKITYTKIDAFHPSLSGFPNGVHGMLITDRSNPGGGYNTQTYIIYNTGRIWTRYVTASATWSEFVRIPTRRTFDYIGQNQSIGANSILNISVPCIGVALGDAVSTYPYTGINGILWSTYAIQDQVTLRIYNTTTSPVSLGTIQWKINVIS